MNVDAGTLIVLSHPNHELALLGHLMRHRPALLFLTDGGEATRTPETRANLARIGIEDHATFLDEPETRFYDRVLARDETYFVGVADAIAARIEETGCRSICFDAVEHYNPTHDLTRPLVERALGGLEVDALFEVPIIRQTAEAPRTFAVQRLCARAALEEQTLTLTAEEHATKRTAREAGYPSLQGDVGAILTMVSDEEIATERVGRVRGAPLAPGPDAVLRYDRRGAERLARGEVPEAITYAEHMQPLVTALRSGARAIGA